MPIYGKHLKKSSSLEPKDPYAFKREKGKTMDFSETIVVYNIKVGKCSQINEYMNEPL